MKAVAVDTSGLPAIFKGEPVKKEPNPKVVTVTS
jgi:hypothetical protein